MRKRYIYKIIDGYDFFIDTETNEKYFINKFLLFLLNNQDTEIKNYNQVLEKFNKVIADLEAQIAEKDKELAYMTEQAKKFNNEAQKYFEDAYCNDFHKRDKISFAVEQLEQIRKEFEIKFKGCKWEDKMLVGKFCNITNEIIDNTIKQLKH